MGNNRKELTPKLAAEWSQMIHALYLEALMSQTDWSLKDIAFHGGTSLRFSWKSIRFSEDLDFLLSKSVEGLDRIAKKIEAAVGEMARRVDANFVIEMKDKTKDEDRMAVYLLSVSHPGYIGKAKIKAEFWRTAPAYLQKYPTELRTPHVLASTFDLNALTTSAVPAATLETAYADKLVAFATRPFVKWRDLYDLWWIGTQTPAKLEMDSLCDQFLHNATAYNTLQGLPPEDALALFLQKDKAELLAQADPDLRNWLPENIWKRMNPDGIVQIVDYVYHAIGSVSNHIKTASAAEVDLKSVPRRSPRP